MHTARLWEIKLPAGNRTRYMPRELRIRDEMENERGKMKIYAE